MLSVSGKTARPPRPGPPAHAAPLTAHWHAQALSSAAEVAAGLHGPTAQGPCYPRYDDTHPRYDDTDAERSARSEPIMCASSAGTRSSPRVPHGPIAVQGRNQTFSEQNNRRDGPWAIRRAKGGSHRPCKAKPLLLSLSRARVTLRLLRTLTYARSSVCAVATQRLHSRAVGVDSGAGAITPIPQRRRGGTEWSASPVRPPTTVLTWCARPTQWYSANLPSGSSVPRSRRDTARHSLSRNLAHDRAHGRRILDWRLAIE